MDLLFGERRYLIPFRSLLLPHVFTDTLVIGGGVAGMRAAVEAATHGDVILLGKDELDVSSSAWAQGGVAAVLSEEDSLESHVQDTLDAGAGLCDVDAVTALVEHGAEAIHELLECGMRLDRTPDGAVDLTREGGHRHRRIVHSDGAATGAELIRVLSAVVRGHDGIRVFDHCFALDLLTNGAARGEAPVLGAITHHPRYGLQIIWARATILATGGAGQVYRETTNPRVATGDGLAMAYRAGAEVADLEFMQFHPTTLYVPGATRTLITEAVRGEGGRLVDRQGVRFMVDAHEMAELAPRDVVSRAIVEHLARSGDPSVFLDVRHLGPDFFSTRFPGLARTLAAFDLDPAVDLIPVRPCAHYTIGGVWSDLDGRTTVPGLYACGEAACNGLHGANRLASNSLLEGMVFGKRAGSAAGEMANGAVGPARIISDIRISEHGELDLSDVRSSLRSAMWRNVGIQRTGAKMADAEDMFDFWGRYTMDKIFDDPTGWEVQNLITVAALITRAAKQRTESRGVHTRLDFPEPSDDWLVHASWSVGAGEPRRRPVRRAAETALNS